MFVIFVIPRDDRRQKKMFKKRKLSFWLKRRTTTLCYGEDNRCSSVGNSNIEAAGEEDQHLNALWTV